MSIFRNRIFRTCCAVFLALVPVGAAAQPICLDVRNMRDSKAVNAHTIMISMIDGSRWRGTLAVDCPGLMFNGFSIFPLNSDQVCEGTQSIRAFQNHQVCRIAKIEKVPPRVSP
jgi:hypothetical protein